MKKSGLLLIALSTVLLTSTAVAGEGPTGFRDLLWGAPEASVRKAMNLERCYPSDHYDYGTTRCTSYDEQNIGEVPLQALTFYLRGGRLVAWSALYHPGHRAIMLPAFVSRFGKPTKQTNTHAEWIGSRGRLSVTAIDSRTDSVRAVALDEVTAHEADRQERARKASKGF